jgi:Eco57I restriction-modification methylase
LSIRSTLTTDQMPRILDPSGEPSHRAVIHCLKYIDKWRQYFWDEWLRAAHPTPPVADLARTIDATIGLSLVIKYARDRAIDVAPSVAAVVRRNESLTLADLCERLAARTASPILATVQRSCAVGNELPIPPTILSGPWEDQVGKVVDHLGVPAMPITFLGAFHELCVGRPLNAWHRLPGGSGQGSRRYDHGVHYTPTAIVDYLTCRVLEPLLRPENSQPAWPVRVLDPSCGCGGFLVAALRYLLANGMVGTAKVSRLSTQQRLDVAEASIFGSDIDPRSVAWARRVVLLTVWDTVVAEGGDAADCGRVPDLEANIVCRDFLASGDSDNDEETANPPAQFEAIIGGPPFVRLQQLYKTQRSRIETYRREFETARDGQFDLYMPFLEKAVTSLSPSGRLGMSVSGSFLRSNSGRTLRKFISVHAAVEEIVEFEDSKVYPDATTQIALLSVAKTDACSNPRHAWIEGEGEVREKLASLAAAEACPHIDVIVRLLPGDALSGDTWSFESSDDRRFLSHISCVGKELGRLPVEVVQGCSTGADRVFLVKIVSSGSNGQVFVKGREYGDVLPLETGALLTTVRGREITGYRPPPKISACVYPFDREGNVLPEEEFRQRFPLAYGYIADRRDWLQRKFKGKALPWYAPQLRDPRRFLVSPKLVSSAIDGGCGFTLDLDQNLLCAGSVVCVVPNGQDVCPYYLLGVLNSGAFWRYAERTMPSMGRGYRTYRVSALRRFPVPDPREIGMEKVIKLSDLVKQTLNAHSDWREQQQLLRLVDAAVNDLYGLNS